MLDQEHADTLVALVWEANGRDQIGVRAADGPDVDEHAAAIAEGSGPT